MKKMYILHNLVVVLCGADSEVIILSAICTCTFGGVCLDCLDAA